jgi:oxygen-independent coproporphyrinogen-3 oxidase
MNLDIAHLMRPGTLNLPALPALSVYVHLPWCLKKCPYCDFNSHEWRGSSGSHASDPSSLPESLYLDALRADLEASLPLVWGRPVHSIFIGGGTPSLFSPEGIGRLVSDLRARLPLVPDCEITLEANPGTFEKERFHAFRAAGVTRLSVGVQSFNDTHLRALGRVHNAAQAHAAVLEASQAFETFNIDLMYALPGQSMSALSHDVAQALSFKPPHLSIYHLTIEPNTLFAKHTPAGLPEDDDAYDMLDTITAQTALHAWSDTRYPPLRKAGTAVGTTPTIGNLVITWAWARVPTASCLLPIGCCALCGIANPSCTWTRPWVRVRWHKAMRCLGPNSRLNSCSTRCA